VVVLAVVVRVVLDHASSPRAVPVVAPVPRGQAGQACAALVSAAPARVSGQPARSTSPVSRFTAAWGEPAVVLRCGVPRPAALRPSSQCFEVDGVGWFATVGDRPAPQGPYSGTLTFTTIGRTANVEVTVPGSDQPAADALVDLAGTVRAHTSVVTPCV
jgi:hypothetical protein